MDRLLDLRQKRLAELQALGLEHIQVEIQQAMEADWKADRIVEIKIAQHQHEWDRQDLSAAEFRAISQRVKLDPDSRIFTYIHLQSRRHWVELNREGRIV